MSRSRSGVLRATVRERLRPLTAAIGMVLALGMAGCAALTEMVTGVAGGVQQVAGGVQQVAQGALVPAPAPAPVLEVEIVAPPTLRPVLERHLDLVRLARLARGESVSDNDLDRLVEAAPSQVQVPCPTPTMKRCFSPRFIRATDSANARAASVAWSAVHTEWLLASGPSPGVRSKRSCGPVALIRKS